MEQNAVELPVHDRLYVWFDANRKNVMVGAVVVLVAAFGISYFIWNKNEKQVKAGESLSKNLMEPLLSGGAAVSPEALLKLASAHAGEPAGAQALLMAGGAYFSQGKYAEAQTQFERFGREYAGNQFMPQSLLGRAACLEAQGKVDDAAAAYKNLMDRYPNASTAPQARFAVAASYAAQGKNEQAINLYEEVIRNDPESTIAKEARYRGIELKMKMPSTPVPAEPTPAIAPQVSPAPGFNLLPMSTNQSK